jgi:hypothetical protein
MLREALTSFGCYPDAWDAWPEKTRLEVRVEKPAGRWAHAAVYWRLGELQKAKRALVIKNESDRLYLHDQ